MGSKSSKTCVTDTQLLLDIQTFIRENVGRRILMEPALPYSEVTVTEVYHLKSPRTFFVRVKGKHYCRNAYDNDDRHSIYFEISHDRKSARKFARWVYQRCNCATSGHLGLCKGFRNKEVELPANLRARLFKEKVPVVAEPEVATTPEDAAKKMLSILDPTLNLDDFLVYKREREADLTLEEPSKSKQLKTE